MDLRTLHRAARVLMALSLAAVAGGAVAGSAETVTATSDRIPVLMYHHLVEDAPQGSAELHVDCFEAQMAFLAEHGYRPLTLDEFVAFHAAGSFPARSLLITFDDGYRSFRELAFPVLERYGFAAVIFPVVSTRPGLQRIELFSEHLSFHDLRSMTAAGGVIDVGSHSYDLHLELADGVPAALRQPQETALEHAGRVRDDLTLSRLLLQQQTDQDVTALAWPYGVTSAAATAIAAEVGFMLQFTTEEAYVTVETPLAELPRFNVAALEGNCFTCVVTRALP